MKNIGMQGFIILIIFLFFVVLPGLTDKEVINIIPNFLIESNKIILGVIHINSLVFIGLTAIILYFSIDKDIKKAKDLHINQKSGLLEAQKVFEQFFENNIKLEELVLKSKSNKTIEKVIKIINYGGIEEDLVLGLNKIFNEISSKYIKLKNDYEYIATIMPIVGMVGTIAGLLTMFAVPSEVDDFGSKFSGLSVALATTLYASMITILIFKPKARNVEEWIVNLEEDYSYIEIAIKQFYHKVDITELNYLLTREVHDVETKE